MSSRRITSLLASLATVALVASGCSHGSTESSPAPTGDSGKTIDTVTVALPGTLSNLYPGVESGILNYYVASASLEGLVHLDDEGKIQPSVASSWTNPNPTTYVFELNPDAKFQDGSPVTPADVVASIDFAKDAKADPSLAYYASGIASAKATGDEEVTVKLKSPDASFLANLSTTGFLYISPASWLASHKKTIGTSDGLLMGTGPYQVTKFVPDTEVDLKAVDTWWGGTPKVQNVTIKFVTDDNARLLGAKSGDFDLAFNVPLQQTEQWENLSDYTVKYANDLSYVGLFFDLKVKPFDDINVRKAIAYSVDRQAIVDKLLKGHGEVATGIPAPEALGSAYTPDEAKAQLDQLPQYDFDLDKAKAALAASSEPNGFATEITYPNTGPQLGEAAQALAANLKEIGIDLTVKEVPIDQWLASIGDGKHGVEFMWYFSTTGDPAEVSAYMIGPGNPANFDNEQANDLIAKQQAETDPKQRIADILAANKISAENAVNLPLWWGQAATAFKKDLGITSFSPFTFTQPWPANLYRAE